MFQKSYGVVFEGDERWHELDVPEGETYAWDETSTYVEAPAVLRGHAAARRRRCSDITGARVLAVLGDSVTTDHISPAGSIKKDSPAGQVSDRPRRRGQGLQLATARAAATTR